MAASVRRSVLTILRPSMAKVPDVGGSIMAIMRASVDLPQPDSPTTASVFPCPSARLTPSTAFSVSCGASGPRLTR